PESRGRIFSEHAELDAHLPTRIQQGLPLQAVEVHAEDLRPVIEFAGQLVELGDYFPAGRAPGRPVIDDQPLVSEAFSRYLSTMLVEAGIGSAACHQQGRQTRSEPTPNTCCCHKA